MRRIFHESWQSNSFCYHWKFFWCYRRIFRLFRYGENVSNFGSCYFFNIIYNAKLKHRSRWIANICREIKFFILSIFLVVFTLGSESIVVLPVTTQTEAEMNVVNFQKKSELIINLREEVCSVFKQSDKLINAMHKNNAFNTKIVEKKKQSLKMNTVWTLLSVESEIRFHWEFLYSGCFDYSSDCLSR